MPNEPTEVMSLDELMDLASEPSSAPTVQIQRPTTPPPTPTRTAPTRTPTPAPAPLNPAARKPAPTPQPRVAQEKLLRATDEIREWLRQGDNGLIAATAFVALLLIVVVASL